MLATAAHPEKSSCRLAELLDQGALADKGWFSEVHRREHHLGIL